MLEKIKCPERDSNPRHPDLMKGALELTPLMMNNMFEICHVTYNV